MDIQELREKSFNFVKVNGPIIPVQIAKFLESDILIASAVLSDLVSQKKVFVTSVKYGGTPFYYAAGQESKLVDLSSNLKGKQREIYDLIRKKRILRDKFIEPWQRVAVREIKDFAKMLRVIYGDKEEIFWRWYSLSDEEAKGLIKNILAEKKELLKREIPVEKVVEKPKAPVEVQKALKEEVKKKVVKPVGEFYNSIISYFNEKSINVLDEKIVRKNKEFDFITEVPSPVGSLKFYIKAKDKKKINDGDLSVAYSEGKSQNMNVLFISCGELTKKAKELIDKKFSGSLLFEKVD